jgi:hypothetical protein
VIGGSDFIGNCGQSSWILIMKIQKLSVLQEIALVIVEFESTVKKSPREHSFILIDLLPIPSSCFWFFVYRFW